MSQMQREWAFLDNVGGTRSQLARDAYLAAVAGGDSTRASVVGEEKHPV
jgi:hypothetical protein